MTTAKAASLLHTQVHLQQIDSTRIRSLIITSHATMVQLSSSPCDIMDSNWISGHDTPLSCDVPALLEYVFWRKVYTKVPSRKERTTYQHVMYNFRFPYKHRLQYQLLALVEQYSSFTGLIDRVWTIRRSHHLHRFSENPRLLHPQAEQLDEADQMGRGPVK